MIPVYPITPQTPVLELLTEFQAAGELDAEMLTPESEHSVMAACIPASLAGVRVFTATASQGLLLMHELLHYASGARAPIVMANVNRTIASPWAFWPDQTDSLAQRDTGWIQFYMESAQEALDTVIQAFRVAERVLLPVMVNLDAFYVSHALEPVERAVAGAGRRVPAALRARALPRPGARRILGQRGEPGHVLPPPPGDRRGDGPRPGGRAGGRSRMAALHRPRLGRDRALPLRGRRHRHRDAWAACAAPRATRSTPARRRPGGRAAEGAAVPAAAAWRRCAPRSPECATCWCSTATFSPGPAACCTRNCARRSTACPTRRACTACSPASAA